MRYLIHSLFILPFLGAAALGCEPPSFPHPEDIAQIELTQSRNGELAQEQQARLALYLADRQEYMELFHMAYPCPAASSGIEQPRGPAVDVGGVVQELEMIESRWNYDEFSQQNGAGTAAFDDWGAGGVP